MADLVERLKKLGTDSVGNYGMPIAKEAATEIDTLRARVAELEALNNGLMEANDEALKQVKASASREAALVEKLKVATDLLDEGNKGFGRILIATSDDKAVRDWQKRCGAALAKIKEES